MKEFLRSLSPRAEFWLVVLPAFGAFILSSLQGLTAAGPPPLSQSRIIALLVYEAVVLLLVVRLLSVRGWRLASIGLQPGWRDTGLGFGFALLVYAAYATLWTVAVTLVPGIAAVRGPLVTPDLTLPVVLALAVLNPVFEETLVTGYLITALGKTRGLLFAVNASVLVRLLYHLYQGAAGILSIVPIGLLFAFWYARTGRLWPLLVAHGVLDLVGLLPYLER